MPLSIEKIDALLMESLEGPAPVEDELSAACRYALEGGARMRPRVAIAIAEALTQVQVHDERKILNRIRPAIVAPEFLHCASLIADDLPCMDNDAKRRGKPTCHIAFGIETALLASYKLIALAFKSLSTASKCSIERQNAALEILSKKASEMSHGQASDLAGLGSSAISKTAALFEATFALSWIYAGGSMDKIKQVQRAGHYFGAAFQAADDLADAEPYASAEVTESAALKTKAALEDLGIYTPEIAALLTHLVAN